MAQTSKFSAYVWTLSKFPTSSPEWALDRGGRMPLHRRDEHAWGDGGAPSAFFQRRVGCRCLVIPDGMPLIWFAAAKATL
jgi:hypothetical protein